MGLHNKLNRYTTAGITQIGSPNGGNTEKYVENTGKIPCRTAKMRGMFAIENKTITLTTKTESYVGTYIFTDQSPPESIGNNACS
jgi:hypothetical protein